MPAFDHPQAASSRRRSAPGAARAGAPESSLQPGRPGGAALRPTCPCGGGCPGCRPGPVQRKPLLSTPGDGFEREADAVAERVLAMGGAPAAAASSGGASADVAPLAPALRAWFEPRFGHDFGAIRVHTGAGAAASARALQARAYTRGRDIVFGAGAYAPGSADGQRLIAHELAHTVQQGAAGRRAGPAASLRAQHAPVVARDADETEAARAQAEDELKNKQWNRAYGRDPSQQYAAERGSIDEDVSYTGQDQQLHTRHQPAMKSASTAVGPNGATGTPMDTSKALTDADVEAVMMDPNYGATDQAQIAKAAAGAGARITEAFKVMQIDTLEAQALYLAHAAVESRGLRSMTAQADPGVVGRFAGRGPLQVTFQQGYVKALAYLDEQASRLDAQRKADDAAVVRAASAAVKADPAAAADPQFAFVFSAAMMHASGGVQASTEMKGRTPQFGGNGPEDRWESGGVNFDERLAHWTNQKALGKAGAGERVAYWKGVKAAGGRKVKAYARALDVLKKNVLAAPVQSAVATPTIQREPAPGATSPPAADTDADAKQKEAAKQLVDHPFIAGLFSEIFKDLAYRKDFSLDEQKKFKLKGTESASYGALFSAALLPIGGAGGLSYGPDAGTSLSTFGKYLDAIEPLTPSNSIKTDLASRIMGLRIDEYLASDTFMKRLKDNAHTVVFFALAAQIGLLAKDRASPPTPDAGGLTDETWDADLLLAKTMIGLALKEKLKAPTIFDTGPLLAPSHPLYEKGNYFTGDLPSGLNVDAASGAAGGDLLHLGATLNLGKFAGGATELDDPNKYRGWQGAVWGDYQHLFPTPELTLRGREPDRRFRAGGLFGKDGLFVLGEVGGRFSGVDARELTSMVFTEGLAYAPADGPVKKIGFKVTQSTWSQGDSLAAGGAPGNGTRVTPFGSFKVGLGGGGSLAFGGSAGITAVTGQKLDLSDWRGDVSYTYLGPQGTADLPAFRVELSGSGSRVDTFNAQSPMLYGVRGKLQVESLFFGAQANVGADKIPPGRAEQLTDPHAESPLPAVSGNSVLIVVGVLH